MGTDVFSNHILVPEEAHEMRELFRHAFLDSTCEHYKKFLKPFSDSTNREQAYWGYMWDCINRKACDIICGNPKEIFSLYKQYVDGNRRQIVLWDVHDKRFDGTIEKLHPVFQTNGALAITLDCYQEKTDIYPEDLYFFDDSFTWAAIFTHEYEKGQRYCLWLRNVRDDGSLVHSQT